MENYYRKVISLELDVAHPDTALEDKEKWNLDRETYLDSLNEYMKVERIISAQEGDEDTEYFVKWKALPYDFCTWESASLISELAQTEIDRYLDRTSKTPVTNQKEANLATRSGHHSGQSYHLLHCQSTSCIVSSQCYDPHQPPTGRFPCSTWLPGGCLPSSPTGALVAVADL